MNLRPHFEVMDEGKVNSTLKFLTRVKMYVICVRFVCFDSCSLVCVADISQLRLSLIARTDRESPTINELCHFQL